jgi:hypothetical protein
VSGQHVEPPASEVLREIQSNRHVILELLLA